MRALLLVLVLAPAIALADAERETCAPGSAAIDPMIRDPLFDRLRATRSELEAMPVANALWRDFTRAPDAHAQDLLDKGMRRIRQGAADSAEPILDELVAYCPDYAEGWNQRAFARFLTGNYDAALEDLERTLEIEPRHFGALAGKGLTLLKQGRQVLGYRALSEGLAIHPWMSERRLLPEDRKI